MRQKEVGEFEHERARHFRFRSYEKPKSKVRCGLLVEGLWFWLHLAAINIPSYAPGRPADALFDCTSRRAECEPRSRAAAAAVGCFHTRDPPAAQGALSQRPGRRPGR